MTKKIEQQNNAAEASAEDRNSFEPQAIYFDTSILYDVRFNGHRLEVLRNHANHLEIPMFVPEIVVKELTLERQNEVRECEACVRKFNAIFPSDLYHLDLSGKPTDFVAKGTRILLESLDIHTIALPEDLSLNTLIELAILRAYSGLSRPLIPEEREHLIRRNASGVSGLARAPKLGASSLSEGSGLRMFFWMSQ